MVFGHALPAEFLLAPDRRTVEPMSVYATQLGDQRLGGRGRQRTGIERGQAIRCSHPFGQ
ncbi:MAG: hypothetical protein ACOC8B_04070 [Gemmatimonadota bacterium]